jgi:hypothetical protein
MFGPEFWMILGFLLAAYSIVANDAIQTLGTFISSNHHRPWWVLWLFASTILCAVLVYGYVTNHGDVSYGRLEKFPPPANFSWFYVIPPVVLVFLTRFGFPVSTTFLILTVFRPENLQGMLFKSVTGYVVAFFVGLAVYMITVQTVEKRFIASAGTPPRPYWIVLQWGSTAFLWTQWLVQDLANIFVFLPRQLHWTWFLAALGVMVALHAIIFYTSGGAIQKIVTSKTNTTDIRSATIVDFIYGLILLVFKEWSNMPMSTTWVFLGLLAGRELAISIIMLRPPFRHVAKIAGLDLSKAGAGLTASVILALALPRVFPVEAGGPQVAAAEPAAGVQMERRAGDEDGWLLRPRP